MLKLNGHKLFIKIKFMPTKHLSEHPGNCPFSHHIMGPARFPLSHPSWQQVLLLSHKLKNEPQNILDTGSAVHEVLYSVRNRPLHQLTNMIRTKSNKLSPQHPACVNKKPYLSMKHCPQSTVTLHT